MAAPVRHRVADKAPQKVISDGHEPVAVPAERVPIPHRFPRVVRSVDTVSSDILLGTALS